MHIRKKLDDVGFAIDLAVRAAAEWVETGIVFNPTRPELRSDPYPFYRRLRERDPVHRSRPASGWVLSRYDDIRTVLADRSFSSDERNWRRYGRVRARNERAGIPDPYVTDLASMLRRDPPDHTRLRGLVSQAFTPRAVERMRPRIEEAVDGLLHGLAGRTEIEWMRDFASPLPVRIIAEMMGVAVDDRERFRHWSNEVVRTIGDGTDRDRKRAHAAMEEMRAWLHVEVEERRRAPRGDLLSELVSAEEAGDRLTTSELFSTCVLLLVAGNETTTNLLGNGLLALLRNPDQLALLREEPKRIPGAIEELLRYDSPVQLTSRLVTESSSLRGRAFEPGDQIVLLLGAGNRDPERFPEPDRLDVTRDGVKSLSFGHGIHACLGAQLARLEAEIAFQRVLEWFPTIRLVESPVVWGDNTVLRGPRALPLQVDP